MAIRKLKLGTTITVSCEAAFAEINRLRTSIGSSFNFNAAVWALDVLVREYNKVFDADYYREIDEVGSK